MSGTLLFYILLRSSIRECLCSEATHGLGVPTTRGQCLIGSTMAQKLGFVQPDETVVNLLDELLAQMQASQFDYSLLFRAQSKVARDNDDATFMLRDRFIDRKRFDNWLERYRAHLRAKPGDDHSRRPANLVTNPKFVLRNYLAQVAIENGRTGSLHRDRMTAVGCGFNRSTQQADYAEPASAGTDNIQVSCSS